MKFDIVSGARLHGRHIGTLPNQFGRAEVQRAQGLGFDTIMTGDYEKLLHAGYEPDQFGLISLEEIQLLPSPPNALVFQADENSLV